VSGVIVDKKPPLSVTIYGNFKVKKWPEVNRIIHNKNGHFPPNPDTSTGNSNDPC
jgi:hypothetical protein